MPMGTRPHIFCSPAHYSPTYVVVSMAVDMATFTIDSLVLFLT